MGDHSGVSADIALSRYLEIESWLRKMFSAVNFCTRYCPYNNHIGCCNYNHFLEVALKGSGIDLLNNERQRIYGQPGVSQGEDRNNCCFFHSPESGCALATHKSTVCLSFSCMSMKMFLEDYYSIHYEWRGLQSQLKRLLFGEMGDKEYRQLLAQVMTWHELVSTKKSDAEQRLVEVEARNEEAARKFFQL